MLATKIRPIQIFHFKFVRLYSRKIHPYNELSEENLFHCSINLLDLNGEKIQLQAVFQDTMPSGSKIGTVVTLHGSSGSHTTFKYITQYLQKWGIRVIGINFPGFGYTSFDKRLKHINTERLQFVQSIIIDALNLNENLIFMGYSRGSENALKMATIHKDRSVGAVLVNATGVRPNRALRPNWVFQIGGYLYDLNFKWLRMPLEYIFYLAFSAFRIRPKTPFIAGLSFKLLTTCNFEDQKDYVDLANGSDLKIINIHSGRDPIIEKAVYRDFSNLFHDNITLELDHPHENESKLIEEFHEEITKGRRHIAVHFPKDGHLLVKTRSYFIADAIHAVLTKHNNP